MMKRSTVQLDLFARKPRSFDEAALIRRLEEAARGEPSPSRSGMSRRQIKRLMRPLPRVTAFD